MSDKDSQSFEDSSEEDSEEDEKPTQTQAAPSRPDDDDDSEDDDSEDDDSEDDDSEDDEDSKKGSGGDSKAPVKTFKDQHFDEAMAVSEDEESVEDSSQSFDQPPPGAGATGDKNKSEFDDDDDDDDTSEDDSEEGDSSSDEEDAQRRESGGQQQQQRQLQQQSAPKKQDDDDDDDDDSEGDSSEEDSSSSDEDEGGGEGSSVKAYNPDDYKDLKVSQEIQDLFNHISRHKPADIELETKLKPFIPDFIPAVGEIDAFLKVPRPDGKSDGLGLTVLDEPAVNQSDPTTLDIKIRVMSLDSGIKPMEVRSIDQADKFPKKISSWIANIEDVHRQKPPPSVNYSKNMPDIEALMQVWPTELEQLFKEITLPQAELDMDIASYARVVCAILDIPVYEKVTESLHVLFTLYTEFKTNSHFQAM